MKKVLLIISTVLFVIILISVLGSCTMGPSIKLSTKIPKDWPIYFPVNENIKVNFYGTSVKSKDGKRWTLTGEYSIPSEDLYDYYKDAFSYWHIENDNKSEYDGQVTYELAFSTDLYYVWFLISDQSKDIDIGIHEGTGE